MSNDFDEQLAATALAASRLAIDCRGKSSHQVLLAFGGAGLIGAIADEKAGGLGLPMEFASSIVAAISGELLSGGILEAMICTRFAAGLDKEIAAEIGAGRLFATLTLHDGLIANRCDGRLEISGSVSNVIFGREATQLLAPLLLEGRPALALLDLAAHGVEREDAETFDLERSRAHLSFNTVGLAVDRVSVVQSEVHDFRMAAFVLYGEWLRSHSDACLKSTSDYLSSRMQFGRPLTSLQSVRFSLARAALELENLRVLLQSAIGEFGSAAALQCHMAFAYSAQVCPSIAETCLHLNGAMGYTWEVQIHRYLRRIRAFTDDHAQQAGLQNVASLALDRAGNGPLLSLSGID